MVNKISNVNKNTNIIVLPSQKKPKKGPPKHKQSLQESEAELQHLEQAVPYNTSQYYNPFATSSSYAEPKNYNSKLYDSAETEGLVQRLIEEEKSKLGISSSGFSPATITELPSDRTLYDSSSIENSSGAVQDIPKSNRGRPKKITLSSPVNPLFANKSKKATVEINPIGGLEPVTASEPVAGVEPVAATEPLGSVFKTSQFPIGVKNKKIKGQRPDRNTNIKGKKLIIDEDSEHEL